MHRFILVAGTILASSFGFALVSLVFRQAVKNSRRQQPPKYIDRPRQGAMAAWDWGSAVRGYDNPEVAREDRLARAKYPEHDRSLE